MGLIFSRGTYEPVEAPKLPVQEDHPTQLLDNLNELLKTMHKLESIKIAIETEILAQTVLRTASFDSMQSAKVKLDEEIECIRSETEQQIAKYKSKTKLFI